MEINKEKKKKPPLLSRLKKAVNKVKFFLRIDSSKWLLSSLLRSPPGGGHRRLSYKRQMSILDCDPAMAGAGDQCYGRSSTLPSPTTSWWSLSSQSPGEISPPGSSISSSPPQILTRTISSISPGRRSGSSGGSEGDDDVDRKAEEFIANFYRRIRMERQVSLDLPYCRSPSP